MKYDFDKIVSREGTCAEKTDRLMQLFGRNDLISMWVADMDFETAPSIVDAISQKADKGVFGYTVAPDEYFDAVCSWWRRRHDFHMRKEWIICSTGVVPVISSVIRKLTTAGENVLIQPPVYNIFYNCIRNNGRHPLENGLVYANGNYSIDFDDLERKLADPQTSLMLLCNPHNPVGKVWNRETLSRIGCLCARHNVLVVSDEIHCDLTRPGTDYTPFAGVSDVCEQNSITCIAPTKTFNLAGLQTAAAVVPNPVLRHKVSRGLNTDEVAEPNAFAVEATIAAFTGGESWLQELKAYIQQNKDTAADYIGQHIPEIRVVRSDATYLVWIDCSALACPSDELCRFIRKETGLLLSAGSDYGPNGEYFLRMNVAAPRNRILDGLSRLKNGIHQYIGTIQ